MSRAILCAAALSLAAAGCSSPRVVTTPPPTPAPAAQTAQPAPATAAAPATYPGDSVPPALGAPKPLQLPPVVERTLPNGLRILVVEHHELPLADVALVVRSGAERDPRNRLGVSGLTAAMLQEGAGKRNALQIADQEAYLGVDLRTSSGWDASRITMHAPTAQLDSALALFADVALRPTFPARELERLRKERLTTLLQMRDRPTAIADQAFNYLVFGEEHPYGRPQLGTETSVAGLKRADVEAFYRTHYRPNNATLIVVGDVSPDDVERRARALFGAWTRGEVPPPTFADAPRPAATTLYVIDKPGAPQSSLRIGGVGVPRSTDDYFALMVANTILGGSFTSRLMQNLRETHGYTYGARSGFSMRQVAGPFTASAEVTGGKTDSSVIEFMRELRRIRDTIPTAELEKAKQYLQLQLPGQFETTGDIAAQLVPLTIYGLPLDYYNTYAQRLSQVTQADVQRVMERYVRPEQMVVVVVGDRSSIEKGLAATGVGRVEVRDITGRKLPTP
ncbi:MAG: M16 family metallopeptidase [Gemmatimonadaceae bacterium]